MRRRQFPLHTAVVATISKANGANLLRLGLWLRQPVFGHGQLYVGTSLVEDPRVVHVDAPEGAYDLSGSIVTDNVVYTQLLGDTVA